MKTEQAQNENTRTGKSHLRAVAWMVATLGAFAATTDALADADTAITEKYYKFVSTRRVSGVNFELTYLALYAADGTVQSDGITADTSTTDPSALAPGTCCTKDTVTGKSSQYGYASTTGGASDQTVNNIFDPGRTNKWCVGYQEANTTPARANF